MSRCYPTADNGYCQSRGGGEACKVRRTAPRHEVYVTNKRGKLELMSAMITDPDASSGKGR